MSNIRVGIIRGGKGPLYFESLNTGKTIIENLKKDKYTPVDIFIDRDGVWNFDGRATIPEKISRNIDVAINALHGETGDSGQMKRELGLFGIKSTGANPLGGSIVFNKKLLKERLSFLNIKTPKHFFIKNKRLSGLEGFENTLELDIAQDIFKEMRPPWIIKPVSGGYAIHTYMAKSFPELVSILAYFKNLSVDILVEEYINGDTIVFGGIDGFRGKILYPLLPSRVKRGSGLWHYDHWHKDNLKTIHPKEISDKTREEIEKINIKIKNDINPGDYYTINAKVNDKGVHVLGIQNQPALSENAPFLSKLSAIGATLEEFLEHLIQKTLREK